MRAPNIVRFSHLNPSYSESLKTLHLYIKSEDERMDKKTPQKRSKNASHEPSQCKGCCNILSWENEGANLHLHKSKERSAQWLYRYTLHERHCKRGFCALTDVSLKTSA